MKKLKYLLILFLMFVFIDNTHAFNTSLKVYDYAQVLTTEEEQNLKRNIDLYIANHNMDMAIVTVKYHSKSSTMAYADDFYDYNGFGIGPNFDGVIFVLDFTFWENGDIWMSTTGKAIDVYTDYRIDSILDSVVAKKNWGYYEMFNTFIEKSNYYAKEGIPIYDSTLEDKKVAWKGIIMFSLVIPSIIILILVLKNKMVKKSTTASIYLLKDSIIINKRSDRFITTHTSSVRINDSSSSSGSSRSHSSTHRSSSGRSHGGGGRRL